MAIEKKYNKAKNAYKITFSLKEELPLTVESIAVCGDFNNWSNDSLILKKQKDGAYKGSVELPAGKNIEFKYLINNNLWTNDTQSDGLVYNGQVDYNSLLKLETI